MLQCLIKHSLIAVHHCTIVACPVSFGDLSEEQVPGHVTLAPRCLGSALPYDAKIWGRAPASTVVVRLHSLFKSRLDPAPLFSPSFYSLFLYSFPPILSNNPPPPTL
ncbi:hypothetical protein K432DRAFT_187399 [Lepidopterella palustris CBS 459.81]|uniref:Uncharacterized protein n=1 Tax=Lepidopterella palustris CBS 459.81 TaxID=1314670 RepID=A0A8E2EL81_9PEZI|nr:hypothetical protein K432DRAFT_187399 [Lepidopterella palustris CBS 459.81]